MTRHVLAMFAGIFVLTSSVTVAHPNFGRDCSTCHVGPEPIGTALEVVNFDGMVNPDESATGAPDRGLRKFFQVEPGGSVDLEALVDLGNLVDHLYAVELKRMEVPGVEGFGTLVYAADPDWHFQVGDVNFDPKRPYFTIPQEEGILFTVPRLFTFTIDVELSTDPDFYDLEFALAGQPEFFYSDEHFYLHVIPEPGSLTLLGLGMIICVYHRHHVIGS